MKSTNNETQWQPCQPGQIRRLVAKRRNQRRLAFAAQLAAGALVGMLLGVAVLGMPDLVGTAPPESDFGGITCSQVRAHAEDFLLGKLDDDAAQRIRVHLKQCPHCAKQIEQMIHKGRFPKNSDPSDALLRTPDWLGARSTALISMIDQ